MKEPYTLFKNIKKARISAGLSQKELAKRLGVSDKTVSAYETGRAIPPTPTLAKIAEITDTPISNLLGSDTDEGKNQITERLRSLEEKIEFLGVGSMEKDLQLDAFVGVVLKDERSRIYLIKETDKYSISKERWNIPGGAVNKDEGFIEAAIREIREETGFQASIASLLGCYKCKKGDNSWIFIVLEARFTGTAGKKTDPDVKQGKWFNKEDFLKISSSKIVHPDMKLVYKIATENKGLSVESVKYIDYDKE